MTDMHTFVRGQFEKSLLLAKEHADAEHFEAVQAYRTAAAEWATILGVLEEPAEVIEEAPPPPRQCM